MRQENARAQVAMPGDAKIRNRQMMLRAICSGQAVTAADIHQSTGISRPTAMRFLQHLCQCGAVAPVSFGESTRAGGKKPELFRFSDQRWILCVNLWPETIALALSGLVGPVYDLEENARRLPPLPGRRSGPGEGPGTGVSGPARPFAGGAVRRDAYRARHGGLRRPGRGGRAD